jgi:hypothetical protein
MMITINKYFGIISWGNNIEWRRKLQSLIIRTLRQILLTRSSWNEWDGVGMQHTYKVISHLNTIAWIWCQHIIIALWRTCEIVINMDISVSCNCVYFERILTWPIGRDGTDIEAPFKEVLSLPSAGSLLNFFFNLYRETSGTPATTGLLYQPRMIGDGDCWEIGGMKIGRGNRSTRKKTCPSATLSTTNPTWLDPVLNPGSQRLTACAMARQEAYLREKIQDEDWRDSQKSTTSEESVKIQDWRVTGSEDSRRKRGI